MSTPSRGENKFHMSEEQGDHMDMAEGNERRLGGDSLEGQIIWDLIVHGKPLDGTQ